jgi:hypothetical protein
MDEHNAIFTHIVKITNLFHCSRFGSKQCVAVEIDFPQ